MPRSPSTSRLQPSWLALGPHCIYRISWLLERGAGTAPLFPEYRRLFVADGLPKTACQFTTTREVRHYLDTVREKVLRYLETSDPDQQERLCAHSA